MQAYRSELQLLMIGAIVAAGRGDLEAGRRGREASELILDQDAGRSG